MLQTPEGKRKAILALRALRKAGPVDDERWADRCLDLLYVRRTPEYQDELRLLLPEAAQTLVHIGDARTLPKLLAMLDDQGPDEPARHLIIGVLGLMGDRSVVEPLIAWFNRQNGRQCDAIYRHVADALIRLADAKVMRQIQDALEHGGANRYHRWTYERALESIMNGLPADNSPRL